MYNIFWFISLLDQYSHYLWRVKMNELFLPTRAVYAFICALLLAGVTGLTATVFLIGATALVFANSFVFQYVVVHWTMKQISAHKVRAKFLLLWLVATSVAAVSAALFLLGIDWGEDLEKIKMSFYSGTILFVAAAAAFVGGSMARRAFTKHGGLG